MSKELSRLEEIELREIWPDEAQDFTPWLAEEENLSLLGETLGLELEFEAKEVNTGNFRADILCKNDDDTWVLIENQLEETDHDHLGKILTYSAGLNAHTVVWISKEFREEHLAALDRLNEITDKQFRYFGVEIKVWQIGDSAPAPLFDVVSSPNDWSRTVNRGTQRAVDRNVSELRKLQEKFWTEFSKYLTNKNSSIPPPNPQPLARTIFRIGKSDFSIHATLVKRSRQIRIQLTIRGDNAKAHYHLLKEQQIEIESEFGGSLEWSELPEHEESHVYLSRNNTEVTDETGWPSQHEWLASKLELFDKVFRQRIQELNAADWEPPENEDDE